MFTDDFAGANDDPALTAGQGWTAHSTDPNAIDAWLKNGSGQLKSITSAGPQPSWLLITGQDAGAHDHFVQLKCHDLSRKADAGSASPLLYVRSKTSGGFDGVSGEWDHHYGYWRIKTPTNVTETAGSFTDGSNVRLTAVGDVFELYADAGGDENYTLRCTRTESGYATGRTLVGFRPQLLASESAAVNPIYSRYRSGLVSELGGGGSKLLLQLQHNGA